MQKFKSTKKFKYFRPEAVNYIPLCNDFSLMNFASVARFILHLEKDNKDHPSPRIIYCVDAGASSKMPCSLRQFSLFRSMTTGVGSSADEPSAGYRCRRRATVPS
jgi:hypothetical protein